MPKLILHTTSDVEAVMRRRLLENLQRSPMERLLHAFHLMELASYFKQGPLKNVQGKGVVLRLKENQESQD
ncbi:MAG: hypothetical protein H6585_02705 [Flavobacteriales bacterium]|nr:hypothetical protein [Flavobacteriales bacterium]MCB9447239.1 hypothetical protein [Flavobacteriales bacterium]